MSDLIILEKLIIIVLYWIGRGSTLMLRIWTRLLLELAIVCWRFGITKMMTLIRHSSHSQHLRHKDFFISVRLRPCRFFHTVYELICDEREIVSPKFFKCINRFDTHLKKILFSHYTYTYDVSYHQIPNWFY